MRGQGDSVHRDTARASYPRALQSRHRPMIAREMPSAARTGASSRWIVFAAVVIVTLMGASMVLGGLGSSPRHGSSQAPDVASAKSFVPHPVISIEGDADFAAQASAEGWPGNGHLNNPYVIAGYEIDGLGYMSAIRIGNTTVHFEIRDCHLFNGVSGVFLYGISNGRILNNTCNGNSQYGIEEFYALDGYVMNNTCLLNLRAGIWIDFSDRNTVSGNLCHDNGDGSDAWGILCGGSNNAVFQNECYDHLTAGIEFGGTASVAYENVCTRNGVGIEVGAGTARDNHCYNNSDGMAVSGLSAQVLYNNCSGNARNGMELSGDYCNISQNVIEDNKFCGIHSYQAASNNDINNNSCVRNGLAGILLESQNSNPCTYNLIARNNCSLNGQHGIHLVGSEHSTISGNTCSNNPTAGIRLESVVYLALRGNVMDHDGILFKGEILQNWVLNTIDQTNLVTGRPVYFAKDLNGTVVPIGYGQYIIANSKNLDIDGINPGNGSAGISLGFCTSSRLANSTSSNNTQYGLYVSHSSGIVVSNCTFADNAGGATANRPSGIFLWTSGACRMSNCSISRNVNGTSSMIASGNVFDNNTIANNSGVGMSLDFMTTESEIRGNHIENNTGYGIRVPLVNIHFSFSQGNRIFLNRFWYNNGAGQVFDVAHAQAYDAHGDNFWNASGYGNYWSDWQAPDGNHDGIVDNPYPIPGYRSTYDYYPLVDYGSWTPIPEFSLALPMLAMVVLILLAARRTKHSR